MPFDPFFTSNYKAPPRPAPPKLERTVEFDLGRSDFLIGESDCPFPPGTDFDEWTRGWLSEKALDKRN